MIPDTAPLYTVSLSPCTGVCRLDGTGLCLGCRRTGEEIARWRSMDDATRLFYLRQVLPVRGRG